MLIYPRYITNQIKESLTDTRVVLIAGPRQAGKTTLAEQIAHGGGYSFFNLDNKTTLQAATDDPVGFIR